MSETTTQEQPRIIASLTINLMDNGQPVITGTLKDRLQVIGLLEMAKSIMASPQVQASNQPSLVVARGSLPPMNGRH